MRRKMESSRSALVILLVLSISTLSLAADYAVCDINSTVKGKITITALTNGSVSIGVNLTGIARVGAKHGFHIHEFGNLSSNCAAAGGHYNPHGVVHGGPTDSVRHVGDLGNIAVNADGSFVGEILDSIVKISGEFSVIGKSFVIHDGEDDLGKGNASNSNTTGNAGARLGCCVITESTTSGAIRLIYGVITLITALAFFML